MVLSKYSNVRLNGSNISYFRDKGYFGLLHDVIEVKVLDLKRNSRSKVIVKCDICGKEKELAYQSYNNNIEKYGIYSCSRKCSQFKIEKTCEEKYGVKNPFQNEFLKEKIKNTLNEKYGVEHPMLCEEIRNKLKNTNVEKYGVEWVFNSEEIKEKIFVTMKERYGCEYALQNEILKKKAHLSYDKEKGFKNAIIIKKYKDTNLYYQGSYEYDFFRVM